jgi:branched-chain amino acid transport system substrate-binding protein
VCGWVYRSGMERICWQCFLRYCFFIGAIWVFSAPFAWALAPVKIGILMDLSGPASSLSDSLVRSAQLAISEISSSKSFMGGRRVEGIVDDSTCIDGTAATEAAKKLALDGVKGIVGALCSGSSISVLKNVAMPNQLPMISPTASSPALTNFPDDHLFSRTAPSDSKLAETMARLLRTKGFKKIAITYTDNDYGYGTASIIADSFVKLGGMVSIVDSHQDGKRDYRKEISELERAGGDVLVIVGYADGGGRHIAEGVLSGRRIFQRVVLADGMLSNEFFLKLGKLLNDSIGLAPLRQDSKVGYGLFEKIANHNGVPIGPYAPEAYDAAAIMLLAMQASGSVEGAIYKHSFASVANPPGIKIFPGELAKGLRLLMDGQEIDYQGATQVNLNAVGEPDGLYEEIALYAGQPTLIKRWEGGLYGNSTETTNFSEEVKNNQLAGTQNQLFDDGVTQDLIENEEFERLRSEVIALRREKEQRLKKIARDAQNPIIRITNATSDDARGVISGVATDDTGVAEIRVDGEIIPIDASGRFTANIFIPVEGKSVEVVAFDLKGLSTTETIRLERTQRPQTVSRLAAVNPLVGPKQKSSRDRAALIIGLEQYAAAPPADYASRDAQMFADYAREKLGIAPGNIKVLTDTEATRSGLLRALKVWLPQAVQPDKTDLYVFYAGHGMASDDGESAYIVPYGADTFLLEDTAISRERFYEEIGAAKPRTATFFFDNCYAGTTRSEERLLAQRPLSIKVQESSVPDNYLVFTAGESNQTAGVLDEVKHGRFSYFVFKGLEGEADANQDGKISAGELHMYVRESVGRFSAGAQTPTMLGDAGRWVLR